MCGIIAPFSPVSLCIVCNEARWHLSVILNVACLATPRNTEGRSRSLCCSEKAISIKYYEYVSVFLSYLSGMQCACAILSSVACPTLQYFSTLSHKRHNFRRKLTEHKMCVLIFSTTFVWKKIFILRKNERDVIKIVYRSSCEVPYILFRVKWNLNFPERFFEKILK